MSILYIFTEFWIKVFSIKYLYINTPSGIYLKCKSVFSIFSIYIIYHKFWINVFIHNIKLTKFIFVIIKLCGGQFSLLFNILYVIYCSLLFMILLYYMISKIYIRAFWSFFFKYWIFLCFTFFTTDFWQIYTFQNLYLYVVRSRLRVVIQNYSMVLYV